MMGITKLNKGVVGVKSLLIDITNILKYLKEKNYEAYLKMLTCPFIQPHDFQGDLEKT